MKPICENVTVQLTGEDGNAFFVISRVRKAMKRAGVEQSTIDAFSKEAMSGDYDHVLRTCMEYVEVA
jgi:ribosomal protein L32